MLTGFEREAAASGHLAPPALIIARIRTDSTARRTLHILIVTRIVLVLNESPPLAGKMKLPQWLSKDVPWPLIAALELIGLLLVLGAAFLEMSYERPALEVDERVAAVDASLQMTATFLMAEAAYLAVRDSARADDTYQRARSLFLVSSSESKLRDGITRVYTHRRALFLFGTVLLLFARFAEIAERGRQRRKPG